MNKLHCTTLLDKYLNTLYEKVALVKKLKKQSGLFWFEPVYKLTT